jgi:hypothetical protein
MNLKPVQKNASEQLWLKAAKQTAEQRMQQKGIFKKKA